MANRLIIAEIPLGMAGIHGTKNMSQVPKGSLIDAEGVEFTNGTIEKEGGAQLYNTSVVSGAPSIMGGHDWNHDGGTQRMVIFCDNGRLLRDSGSGAFGTTLATGLDVTGYPVFVEAGKEVASQSRRLFVFSGTNSIYTVSGDTSPAGTVTTGAADWSGSVWPTFGVVHESILWAGGNSNDPNRMYYSTATNHADFTGTGSGSIAVYPGDSVKLVGAVSYKGGLICFKFPQGIYLIDTSDSTAANWRVKQISEKIGVAGLHCYTRVENDVLFLDSSGDIRLLSSTDEYGDVGSRSLSDEEDMGPWIRENIDMSKAEQFVLTYYPTKRQAHLACTEIGNTVNNMRIIMDFNTPGRVKFSYSRRDDCVSLWTRLNNRQPQLVAGDSVGFIYTLDEDDSEKDSGGYDGVFQTAHMDFSDIDPRLAVKRKNGKFLELVTEPIGNWNLSVDIYWDGEYSETVTFDMGSEGAALGSFTLDTDALGGSAVNNRKRRIVGSGRRISLKARNSGVNQGFSVARFLLHFTVGNEML